MGSIYRSAQSKKTVLALYDRQLAALQIPYTDVFVDTGFGRTHLIECGSRDGEPLLLFHGGNVTSAYNLRDCRFLMDSFHIYAVDTIGHPGKSAETSLSPRNRDYGKWVAEVIKGLGAQQMACLGGSFGAGILVKAMCAAPSAVKRCVLLVPAALQNAPAYHSLSMAFPLLMYRLTHKEDWFVKCMLPMTAGKGDIPAELLQTARCSLDHAKIKAVMPQNEPRRALCRYTNPVLVMAAEKDRLFPADGVLRRAEKVWPQSERYLLRDRGHINTLTAKEQQRIVDFLRG